MQMLTGLIEKVATTLGNQYTLTFIDDSWCLYRDLGNGYDIEVNLGKTRKHSLKATVYVWQVRDKLKVIDRIDDISEIEDLEYILSCVVNRTNRLANRRNKMYMSIAI